MFMWINPGFKAGRTLQPRNDGITYPKSIVPSTWTLVVSGIGGMTRNMFWMALHNFAVDWILCKVMLKCGQSWEYPSNFTKKVHYRLCSQYRSDAQSGRSSRLILPLKGYKTSIYPRIGLHRVILRLSYTSWYGSSWIIKDGEVP